MGYSYQIILEERVGNDVWVELEKYSNTGSGHSACCHYFYSNVNKAEFIGEDSEHWTWYAFSREQISSDYNEINWKESMKKIIDESSFLEEAMEKLSSGEYLVPYWNELEKWYMLLLDHSPETCLRVRYGISV